MKFNMQNCKPVSAPMEPNLKLEKGQGKNTNLPYQQLIGSLMYLAVLTRPDISYCVSYLSQFNDCFDEIHWKSAKRVLRYLKCTKSKGLLFKKSDTIRLEGFADADWASNVIDRKSYSGYCFKLSGAVVSWESRKQCSVSLSSTEAEYIALSEASKEAIYLYNLLGELIGTYDCITLYNDNQSAQKLCLNPTFHKRTKHIDVRYHFIRETISNNIVSIEYLSSNDMPADVLTKGLNSVKHNHFLDKLGISIIM